MVGGLAIGWCDGSARRWDVGMGRVLGDLRGHGGLVSAVAFDGNDFLASGSYDRTVRLWEQ